MYPEEMGKAQGAYVLPGLKWPEVQFVDFFAWQRRPTVGS